MHNERVTYEYSSSSSSTMSSSTQKLCVTSSMSELLWMATSFTMFSIVFLYIGFQACKSGYSGSRGVGTRIRFPENVTTMIYVWMSHILFSVLTAFMAYVVGGGWTSITTVVLSLYIAIEIIHSGWMIAFFRCGSYGKGICLKIFMVGVQVYMLVLYGLIHSALFISYFVPVLISCYESVVNIIILAQSCRRYSRVSTNIQSTDELRKSKEKKITQSLKEEDDEIHEIELGNDECP